MRLMILLSTLLWIGHAQATDLGPEGLAIDLSGGAAIMSTQMEGQGFASDLSPTTGTTYRAAMSYGVVSEAIDFGMYYSNTAVDFDAPSNVTPSSVNVQRVAYGVSLIKSPALESAFRRFKFGIAYNIVEYRVEQNSPAVINDQSSQGISLSVARTIDLSEKWSMLPQLEIYTPHQFHEPSEESGFNPRYLGLEGSLKLNWKAQEDFSVYVGAAYRRESVGFSGTGTRQSTAVRDTRTTISFPLGLRWEFY